MDVAKMALIISGFATLFSYLSMRIAKKALSISKLKESRRQPSLKTYLIDGYYRKLPDRNIKIYAFSISISNPTDADNCLAYLDLEIAYTNSENTCMKIKIPHQHSLVTDFGGGSIRPVIVPTPILAHQTVAGWVLFEVSDALLGACAIDSYLIKIIDTHGLVTIVEPDLAKELKNV